MTIDEQIAVLQALKEGRKIEARSVAYDPDSGHVWFKWEGSPNFVAYDYRIVPEPRRFIIYRYGASTYAQTYSEHIPATAEIICTAVEEPNLGESVAPMLDALKQTLRSDEEVRADGKEKLTYALNPESQAMLDAGRAKLRAAIGM